jgi:hypothetical protein
MLLRFDPTYKHVLNVDYSERKNQSYIFDIKRLEEYKISFLSSR